jgi:hypothetical protein
MTAPPTAPPKRRKKLVILALLVLLIGAGTAVTLFYLDALKQQGIRLSFAEPGGMVSAAGAPLVVQPSPELAAAGMACKHLGTASDVEQVLFLRKEECFAQIEISATGGDLDLSGLSYVLYDADGREVGRGRLRLSGTLKQGESRSIEIPDYRIPEAQRAVIGK